MKVGGENVPKDDLDGDSASVPEKVVPDRGPFAVTPAFAVVPAQGEESFEVSFFPTSLSFSR